MNENISILGSTGSIGTQALDVARMRNFNISALCAYSNVDLMEKQIREFKPAVATLIDEKSAKDLKVRVADTNTHVFSGTDGVCECAAVEQADIVLNAIVGMAGLMPTLAALDAGKTLALANKETLVAGGMLVTEKARQKGVQILPVDSEHSAIFQCLQGAPPNGALKSIILTSSGGPFFGKTLAELEQVTLENALNHPNWAMGPKITIDSATMMNKGLELIEAVWLFDMPAETIEIVVHRESIIHSLIEYEDHSVIAQLGLPDMRIPIQYALTYPERYPSPARHLDLTELGKLTFYKPDYETFPCLNICRRAINKGGLYPAMANSANEQANLLFREGKISFLQISELVGEVTERAPKQQEYSLEDVLETDRMARALVLEKSKI